MADFIFKPSANNAGDFTNSLAFEGLNPTESVAVADGIYDIYEKVVVGFSVSEITGQFGVSEVDGDLVVDAQTGAFSYTITNGPYAGTYTQRVTDGATLTVALVEAAEAAGTGVPIAFPVVSGDTSSGGTLAITPGLWLASGSPLNATWQQQLNGSDIPEGTDLNYTVTAAALGASFSVRETFGTTTIESAAVSIGVPASTVTPLFIGGGVSGNTSISQTETFDVDMASNDPAQDVIMLFGSWSQNPDGNTLTAITLNGVAATSIINVPGAPINGALCGYARFPAGSYSVLSQVVTTAAGETWDVGVACYNVPASSTVSTLATAPPNVRAGSDLSGNVSEGNGVIAAQFHVNGQQGVWTGLTEDFFRDIRSGDHLATASAGNVPAASPRVITTLSPSSAPMSAIAVKVV